MSKRKETVGEVSRAKKASKIVKTKVVEDQSCEWKKHLDETPSLQEISNMVKDVGATTSLKAKKNILRSYATCCRALLYTMNPYWLHRITSTNIEKLSINKDIKKKGIDVKDIFELLDALRSKVSGHDAVGTAIRFIEKNHIHKDIILSMIDKDFKFRCAAATVNSVFDSLIPQFQTSLANTLDDKMAAKIDFRSEEWYASRKMDGVRVLTFIDNDGNIVFKSREGNEFETLTVLHDDIKPYGFKNVVLDGEVCVVENGVENFKKTISQIKKRTAYIHHPRYFIFDVISPEEFLSTQSLHPYLERHRKLLDMFSKESKFLTVQVLNQSRVSDEHHVSQLSAEAISKGWEGLILRKNVPYEGKRTNNMLKVKVFHREEYEVVDMTEGEFRIVEGGEERTVTIMSAVGINHKGKYVSVGSGFSIAERTRFHQDPYAIIAKKISVQYFEETEDGSLRFPSFMGLYGDERNI